MMTTRNELIDLKTGLYEIGHFLKFYVDFEK